MADGGGHATIAADELTDLGINLPPRGVMVEVLKDVAFRVLSISARSARRMIDEIKSATLLNGFRGRPLVDKKAIQHLLLAVSEIIGSYPEIQEMDLNPVIAYEDGLNVVDVGIILTPEDETRW